MSRTILPQRKQIRLKNYDYSQSGLYFVTICTENRECLFGDIVDGKMVLNNIGNMIQKLWNKIPERFNTVKLDIFQIMPNHIHTIIHIVGATLVVAPTIVVAPSPWAGIKPEPRAGIKPAPTTVTLGDIIGAFKSLTTHEYVMGVKNNGWKPFDKRLWQRNYYEHVIRTETDLNKIREYIINNPSMWDRDRDNLKTNG
jgi:REP element-mobilizing transposase RayT